MRMQVSAAVTRENGGTFVIEDRRIDEPRGDEVLFRIVKGILEGLRLGGP